MTQTIVNLEKKENPNDKILIRFAWGYNNTWLITKHKKQVVPKGARLLIQLGCKHTDLTIHTKEVYPTIGDVITDTDGNKLLIETCELL